MRDLTLDEPAALIYCPFRALLHLPTWSDRCRTFERVAANLLTSVAASPGTRSPSTPTSPRVDGQRQDKPVPHTFHYAVGDNRIDITLDDDSRSSLLVGNQKWLGLVEVAGLHIETLYGGFAREPFTEDSREYVFIARR